MSSIATEAGMGAVTATHRRRYMERKSLVPLLLLLIVAGAGWVQALAGFSVAGQLWAPREVVGRIVALVSSLTFGGIALGSWLWGHFAEGYGVAAALMVSGGAMIVLPLIGILLPMPRHDSAQIQGR